MKKFLNYFLLASIVTMFVASCKPDDEPFFEGDSLLLFESPEVSAADGDYALAYGVTNAVDGDHNVSLVFNQSKSTAVLGTDFTIVKGSDVLKGGTARGDFKINVTQAAAIAKKNAVFTMTNSTLGKATFNQEVLVNFACSSNLAGTYAYSTVNYFTPDTGVIGTVPVTGSVTFTVSASSNEYTVSDASFGGYRALYGGTTTATGVRMRDLCNKISLFGTNQYGDTHAISNVVVNGNKLTFRWSTSYGEYGTTTLTKSNGNWPALN